MYISHAILYNNVTVNLGGTESQVYIKLPFVRVQGLHTFLR